jgi:DNA-binding IclR family transcriptional regulator
MQGHFMPKGKYVINSVVRAIQVLKCFSFDKPTYKLSEFQKKLGFNKTTLTRILASLEEAGVIEKDEPTKQYKLTYHLFHIGNVYRDQMDLYNVAMPLISQLAASEKETVHLAILDNFRVLYIGKIESTQSIRIMSRIGSLNPCYSTGVGKVMLAYLDEDEIERFFYTVKLERFTPNTIWEPNELRHHLKRIKEQGYAIDEGENEEEVRCVAAPIFDRNGKVIAGLSISGPVFRMSREKINQKLIPAAKETAQMISKSMGYLG